MKIPGSGMYSFFQQNVGKYAGELNTRAILEIPGHLFTSLSKALKNEAYRNKRIYSNSMRCKKVAGYSKI